MQVPDVSGQPDAMSESAEKLARLLAELNAHDQVTLIVVTHSAELARHMGRKLELRGGALLESSP